LEIIWNFRAKIENMSLKHAFWWYLKQFGTAERKNENRDGKWCILTVFETIWNWHRPSLTWKGEHKDANC